MKLLLLHLVAAFLVALVLNAPATVCPTQSRTQHALAALARSANSHQQSAVDPWWKHAVIYEIYPRSFQDSDGDGVGDLNGITRRLAYLKDLGIDAIWLTPVFPSPQVDFGYDISDYTSIDPQYGTMADFDRLVARGEAAGHPGDHGPGRQSHLRPALMVQRVTVIAQQFQTRLVPLASWQATRAAA